MGSIEPLRYDNLHELIENVEFNGDVLHDYSTKVKYCKVIVPFKGIPTGSRNNTLTAIAYQQRALNPLIEKSFLFRILNKHNQSKCEEPLPVDEINSIVGYVMDIVGIVPLENADRRFVFNPDYDLTVKERRQQVMKVLNTDRINKSKKRFEEGVLDWDFNVDGKITQKGLAQKISMNIKTVKKYYPLYKSEIQQLNKKYNKNN